MRFNPQMGRLMNLMHAPLLLLGWSSLFTIESTIGEKSQEINAFIHSMVRDDGSGMDWRRRDFGDF
jgi:hypothetical protein